MMQTMAVRALLGIATITLVAGFGPARTGRERAQAPKSEPIAHTYRQVAGRPLQLFVLSPSRPARGSASPAVLLLHGGGWAAGSAEWMFDGAKRFADEGLVAIAVDYRLSDATTTPIDALGDVCAAFRWTRDHAGELGVNRNRVAAYGVSAGGHLAAAAATVGCGNTQGRHGVGGPDALIMLSPALDVVSDGYFKTLLQGRAQPADYSPIEHVRPRMPPVAIVQGSKDTLTPLRGAQRFCERITSGGGRCDLHVYEGVGHLLTRNLANQESDFDPDPAAREDGLLKQIRMLHELWRD